MRSVRRQLPALGLLFFIGVVSAGGLFIIGSAAASGTSFERYSTHRAEPDGALALHDWWKLLGFDVRRETEELVMIPEDGGLLVLVGAYQDDEPKQPAGPRPAIGLPEEETLTKTEVKTIASWVERGGRLLIFEGHRNPIYARFGIATSGNAAPAVGDAESATVRALPVAISRYTSAGGALATRGLAGLVLSSPELVPLYRTDDGRVVAASARVGEGEVIAVSDPYVATNDGIKKGSNRDFLLAVASGSRGRAVRFDERRHGFAAERNVMGYVRRYGLDAAALQAVLIFVLIAWAARSSRARPRVPPPREGVESREFVSAMANIYARMHLRSHAVETYYRRAERALAAALRSRGVATRPLPDDEIIRTELRAIGVQNWSGWEYVRTGYVDLAASLATGAPIQDGAEPAAQIATEVEGAPPPGATRRASGGLARLGRVVGRQDRWMLSYARFASRFEREVREAAHLSLDEVVG